MGIGKREKLEKDFSMISIEKWREKAKFGESTLQKGREAKRAPSNC